MKTLMLVVGALTFGVVVFGILKFFRRSLMKSIGVTSPRPRGVGISRDRSSNLTTGSPVRESSPPPDGPIDKNVQFTVYRPATVVPQRWYTMLAFAHLSKSRPDAPEDEPDPVKEVQRQAARILSDQPARYEATKLDRGFSVPRKGLLTFVPLIEGCEFNPPTQSIMWRRTVHKLEFEMTASASVDGQEVEGQMTVYLGNIILTEVPLRINVDSRYVAPKSEQTLFEEATAEPYRKIFASYSHKDTEIVEDFENYVQALGDQYLRDIRTLRAGEVFSEELERMIREASVFQLFWSSNSMPSKFVKQEWEYALKLNKPKFIRPVYWEEPLPEEEPDLPPEALKRLHFYKLRRAEEEKARLVQSQTVRVFTLSERGQTARIFDIPEADLQKYNQVQVEESRLAQSGETVAGTENAKELEAASPEGDLEYLYERSSAPHDWPTEAPDYSREVTSVRAAPIPTIAHASATTSASSLVLVAGLAVLVAVLAYVGYRIWGGSTPTPAPAPVGSPSPTPPSTPNATPMLGSDASPRPTTTAGSTPTPMHTPTPMLSPTPTPSPPTPTPSPPTPTPSTKPTVTPTQSNSAEPPPIGVSISPVVFQSQGDLSSYRLVVSNVSSGSLKDVVITERLPVDIEYVSSNLPSVRQGQTIVWRVGEIPANGSIQLKVSVRLKRVLQPGETFTAKQQTTRITYIDAQGNRRTFTPRS